MSDSDWEFDYEGPGTIIHHLHGIDWYEAKVPRRWHRCRPQTRGLIDGEFIERCPCGATRIGLNGQWFERNSRRAR